MRAIGIVLAGGNSNRMRELSDKRAVAAMPIAGGYRSIDFVLSSMSNSHIQKVAVFTQYNAKSLNDGGILEENKVVFMSLLLRPHQKTVIGIGGQLMQ